jgi:hypothetical protein
LSDSDTKSFMSEIRQEESASDVQSGFIRLADFVKKVKKPSSTKGSGSTPLRHYSFAIPKEMALKKYREQRDLYGLYIESESSPLQLVD